MAWLARKVRSVDILPNVVLSGQIASGAIFRDVVPDDALYTDKLLEWHANISALSGGAAVMTQAYAHNLGSAKIYGASLLSHASSLGVNLQIGLVNASQITLKFEQSLSGQVAVSGLVAHTFVIV